ncbi:hypothetical protein ABT203_08770 [Streptomyces sp900105245]|uniref:hypothetical protein n=1 Tax=Streptomyces sp. 900105245 TaxID=3154379 RepID=UPI00331DDC53
MWEAVTTGTGGYLWPTEPPEPRVGGKGPLGSTVTAWDPPHRYTHRSEDAGLGDRSLDQVDHTVEPRDGGRRSWVRGSWGAPLCVGVHDFAPDADAEANRTAWQDWLNGVFGRS